MFDGRARAKDGMARAFLLGLLGKANARYMDAASHLVRLVTYHRHNALGRRYLQGGPDDLVQQRVAAGLVQYLGFL